MALEKYFKEGRAHTVAFFLTFHNTTGIVGGDNEFDGHLAAEVDGEDTDLSLAGEGGTDGCGNDLREGKGDAMGLDVRELAMVELLDKEGEEVEPSSLPSRFLLRREFSLSTAATS